jgi:hypothetical protein
MIELFFNLVSSIAGIITTGLGFAVVLTGIKIMITGLGWVF